MLVDGIRTFRFGWRQPAAILGGVALLLPVLGFTADAIEGRWHAPRTGWVDSLAFTDTLSAKGQFRTLWLGEPAVLPLDPVVLSDGTGYTLTRDGSGNSSELLRAPEDDADHVVDHAIELARDGLTNRLGRLLAPMGVRWVAMPSTQGPGGGVAPSALPGWRRALDGQLDLARLRTARGLVLYENLAWIPLRAAVSRDAAGSVPLGPRDPIRAALGADLSGAEPLASGAAAPPGVVFWGEAYDSKWKASSSGQTLRHVRAFGWANGYRVTREGSVSIAFADQWQRWLLLAVSLLIWLFVVFRWWRTRVRVPRLRGPGRIAKPVNGAPAATSLRTRPTMKSFWWERV